MTGKAPKDVRYFCFTGTHMPTLTHVRIGSALQVIRVEADSAGDGTVPSWSGGLQGVQGQLVGGEHGTIYKNRDLLLTLGGLLGVKNTLAANIPNVQVTILDKVMEPNAIAHLTISLPFSAGDLTGEVVVERVIQKADGQERVVRLQSYPVKYEGIGAERLGLTFTAPQDPGFYRVYFVQSAETDFRAYEDFLVQDTLD